MTKLSRPAHKEICVAISNDGYRLFFSELLREWEFTVLTSLPLSGKEVILADDLFTAETAPDRLIRLTHAAQAGQGRLSIPFPPDALWILLENLFHKIPRKHIRLPIEIEITTYLRGEKSASRLTSLSQAGARLCLPRELAQDETFTLILPLLDQVFHLSGRVIYTTPLADTDDSFDTGVLFERIDHETRQLLNDEIILAFLRRILPRLPRWAFEVGVSTLELPPALLDRL